MPVITPQDTADIFIGSGALQWSWYWQVEMSGAPVGVPDGEDGWTLTFVAVHPDEATDDEDRRRYGIDDASILRAVRKIARGEVEALKHGVTRRECQTLLFRGPDECDFDACSADNVMQVAAFGEVIYG